MCGVQSGLSGLSVTCSRGALPCRPTIAASGGTSQGQHRPSLAALDVGYWESSLCLCAVLLGLQSLFTGASLQGPDVGVIGTLESGVWLASAHRPCFLSAHHTSLLVLALPFFLGPQAELLAFLSFLPAPPLSEAHSDTR